jgi:hypothetical protein
MIYTSRQASLGDQNKDYEMEKVYNMNGTKQNAYRVFRYGKVRENVTCQT